MRGQRRVELAQRIAEYAGQQRGVHAVALAGPAVERARDLP